jgi:hypothetical protein
MMTEVVAALLSEEGLETIIGFDCVLYVKIPGAALPVEIEGDKLWFTEHFRRVISVDLADPDFAKRVGEITNSFNLGQVQFPTRMGF